MRPSPTRAAGVCVAASCCQAAHSAAFHIATNRTAEDAPALSLPPEAAYADLLNQTCTLGMAAAPLWAEALAAGGDEAKAVAAIWGVQGITCPGGKEQPINDAANAVWGLKELNDPGTAMP